MKLFKKITAVLLIMTMGLTLAACGNSKSESKKESDKYDGIIDILCESKINADMDKFMSVFGSMENLMREVVTQDVLDQTKATYEESCGENLKVSYEFKEEKKVDGEKISNYEDTVSLFGDASKLSEAYDLTVDVKVKGSKGDYDYEMTVSVGKTGDKWMVVNFDDTLLK